MKYPYFACFETFTQFKEKRHIILKILTILSQIKLKLHAMKGEWDEASGFMFQVSEYLKEHAV